MRRKTTIVPLFSNGTEFTLWMERNCARCYKAPHLPRHDGNDYYDNGATFTKCYCAVHRDIDRQVIGQMEISLRSADIVANYSCPYRQEHWPRFGRKDPLPMPLFEAAGVEV